MNIVEDLGLYIGWEPAEQYMLTATGRKRVINNSPRRETKETPIDKLVKSAIKKTDGKQLESLVDAFESAFGFKKGVNAAAGVIRYILVQLAMGCPADEATTPLSGNGICPVPAKIMTNYAKCIAQECFTEEVEAVKALIDKSRAHNLGEYMKRRDFCMYGGDDDYDDNDPINGWLYCAKEKELREAIELSQREKDKDQEALLVKQDIALLKEEAAKNNPLAIFYLGVKYWRAWQHRREKQDYCRAVAYLTTAEMMGVQRASNFIEEMKFD